MRAFRGLCPSCGVYVDICCGQTTCDFCDFDIDKFIKTKKKTPPEVKDVVMCSQPDCQANCITK